MPETSQEVELFMEIGLIRRRMMLGNNLDHAIPVIVAFNSVSLECKFNVVKILHSKFFKNFDVIRKMAEPV